MPFQSAPGGQRVSLIAAVDDLFFSTRIRETARQIGVHVEVVATTRLRACAAQGSVDAVILDLSATSALEILRALKADPQTSATPVIGYVSHVADETIAAARAAGCDRILARSAFTRQLPELLRELGARQSGTADQGPFSPAAVRRSCRP
jgi:CheY-like chemotaxis protein